MKNIHIKIAVALGLFALIRPIIKIIADFNDATVAPVATLIISVVIAAVWVCVAVQKKLVDPVKTLAAAGVVYAVSSILMAVIVQTLFPEHKDPETSFAQLLTVGLIATTIFNSIYGAILGMIAKSIYKPKNSK